MATRKEMEAMIDPPTYSRNGNYGIPGIDQMTSQQIIDYVNSMAIPTQKDIWGKVDRTVYDANMSQAKLELEKRANLQANAPAQKITQIPWDLRKLTDEEINNKLTNTKAWELSPSVKAAFQDELRARGIQAPQQQVSQPEDSRASMIDRILLEQAQGGQGIDQEAVAAQYAPIAADLERQKGIAQERVASQQAGRGVLYGSGAEEALGDVSEQYAMAGAAQLGQIVGQQVGYGQQAKQQAVGILSQEQATGKAQDYQKQVMLLQQALQTGIDPTTGYPLTTAQAQQAQAMLQQAMQYGYTPTGQVQTAIGAQKDIIGVEAQNWLNQFKKQSEFTAAQQEKQNQFASLENKWSANQAKMLADEQWNKESGLAKELAGKEQSNQTWKNLLGTVGTIGAWTVGGPAGGTVGGKVVSTLFK